MKHFTKRSENMGTYSINGKNKAGEAGLWDIEADSKEDLEKILISRGMKAENINGETVKRVKLSTLKEDDESAI